MRSQLYVAIDPMPMASPLTAATIGFAKSLIRLAAKCCQVGICSMNSAGDATVWVVSSARLAPAENVATAMVSAFGMGQTHGPIRTEAIVGSDTPEHILSDVKSLVWRGQDEASHLLGQNLPKLHRLAQALMDEETLDRFEIEDILGPMPTWRADGDPSDVVDCGPVAVSRVSE